ncbi:hypothetical protein KIN20_014242 [Parelaphostrongylus tenuis]|uniref:Uncharacterized protein n=1 Tax=Parelaphostrongylus tenuis TaxID=148309 RepID=A0AAD5MEN3_PARTN|nr:hypothetical protein KIN20_014242 [Parelaphostrongylus tenuis]
MGLLTMLKAYVEIENRQAGYVRKMKKKKHIVSRIRKRTLAKTSAKVVKNKRKKILAKRERAPDMND